MFVCSIYLFVCLRGFDSRLFGVVGAYGFKMMFRSLELKTVGTLLIQCCLLMLDKNNSNNNNNTSSFAFEMGLSEIDFIGSRSHFQVDKGPDSDSP